MIFRLVIGMALVFSATAVHSPQASLLQTLEGVTSHFAQYRNQFGRSYAVGSEEHQMRQRLFAERVAKIQAHNTHPKGHSWRAGINHLTDRTEDELLQLRGFRRHGVRAGDTPNSLVESDKTCSSRSQQCGLASSGPCCKGLICGAEGSCQEQKTQPASVDWSTSLISGSHVVDQGPCGSCWAIAAQGAIELQAALLANRSLQLSAQGMLGCTPNPHECGGTGGCDGATPELAFNWAKDNGLYLISSQAYTATSNCPKPSLLQRGPVVKIKGFVHLQENSAKKAMAALVTAGPVSVGVAASTWLSYSEGIFDGCNKDATIDHAVLMVGYGAEGELGYWKIRNSWGMGFGESGFIRLRRHAPKEEEPCGWDYEPQQGVGCKGGPPKLWVCGVCGVLSDIAYPVGTAVVDGMSI